MNQRLMSAAIGLGICYAAYKFVPNSMAKTAAIGVGATIVAKQLPYLQDALA